ncbi:cell morphogenesis C-terminal-domain-containing protein [Gongronella butleri]|nr:cell morphogenesis C-terminal-domain-containing protein [Gongronella butleri]
MPRLMPAGIPLPQVVDLLARYTVHLDPELVHASALALRRIAKQIDSQTVVMGYARFVQRIEDKAMDVVDALADGIQAHLDDTSATTKDGVLDLYVDLLAIWVNQVDLATLREIVLADPSPHLYADVQADVDRLFHMVEETEAMGLLFVCHQATRTRSMGMQMIDWAAKLEKRLLAQVDAELAFIDKATPSPAATAFVAQLQQYVHEHRQRTPFARLHDLLHDGSLAQELIQFDKDKNLLFGAKLSIETRLRLQHHQRRATLPVIAQLATSDDPTDQWIWHMCFMGLLKHIFTHFTSTVALARFHLCERLLQIQPSLLASIELSTKASTTGTLSIQKGTAAQQKTMMVSPDLVEQWKVYLSFVCATASSEMTALQKSSSSSSSASQQPPPSFLSQQQQQQQRRPFRFQSDRKGSAVVDRIASTDDLIRLVLPFLPCDHRAIREAAIHGLGHLHVDAYATLMHLLQPDMRTILEEGKHGSSQKPYQNKRNRKNDRLRTSLLHVLALTVHCLENADQGDTMRKTAAAILAYIKETKVFLSDTEVQLDWEYHKLRVYLCRLVEQIYKVLLRVDDAAMALMSFETRLSLYKMFEEWCGYGAHAHVTRSRDAAMIRDVLDQCKDAKDRAHMTKLMEEERKALETASLNAMAMLCRGPSYSFLGQKKARQAVIQFDMLNVLRWIDAVFESPDPKHHLIARDALEAVLYYNQDQPMILDDVIEQCYAGNPKLEFTQGYFLAIVSMVTREAQFPCQVKQIISLALFKAGDAKKSIRKAAMQLLRVVEERVFGESCAKDYEIGIHSSLPTIYKHTQTLLSARLAVDHPEETHEILSEMTQRFEHISPNSQRDVLIYMLPWLRRVDLSSSTASAASSSPSSLSSTGGASAANVANNSLSMMLMPDHPMELNTLAYVVLNNLYYITIKFGDTFVKEIGALWNQLVDQGRNVRPITAYLLEIGLEKRNPWFLVHAKRVFVCLGRTPAFARVVEEVIGEISPRSMVPQVVSASSHASVCRQHPTMFIADTDKVLPLYAKKPAFARGQLAMVYLVDLAIEAGADLAPHLPLLLHCIVVQLDHLTSIICDQARCLLINLIHAIVVRQALDDDVSAQGNDLIQWLASKEGKRLWAYENISPTKNRHLASSQDLKDLVHRILAVFSHEDPDLRQKWGETALKWATCCSVRHIACRSFQCFRGLLPAFNQHMLADTLVRLSNTVADKSEDIRGFSLEIILTLMHVARAMDRTQMEQFPQLFWAGVACLYGPYPSEQVEALNLLLIVLDKLIDRTDLLIDTFPIHWASEFDGLQPLLLKGLQHEMVEDTAWRLLRQVMNRVDNLALIDPTPTRFLFLFLGAVPRLLHGLEDNDDDDPTMVALASELARLAHENGLLETHRLLQTYPKQKAKFQDDYLKQLVWSLGPVYLDTDRQVAAEALMFVLRMANNTIDYYRDKSLKLLEILLPYVKSKSPDVIRVDLVSLQPLLRLIDTPAFADRALSILNQGFLATEQPADVPIPNWRMDDFDCTKMTRKNVHAVVYECATNRPTVEEDAIQFSVEDFSLLTGDPQYAPVVTAAGMISTSPTARSSMDEPTPTSSSTSTPPPPPHHPHHYAHHLPHPSLSPTLSPTTVSGAPSLTPSSSVLPSHMANSNSNHNNNQPSPPLHMPMPQPASVPAVTGGGDDLINALKDLDDFFNQETDASPPPRAS